jgi:lipopolysaccharide transport system ATP-binding protein
MTDIAIRVENLGKHYHIGVRQKRANTLRETLGNLTTSPFDYLRSTLRGPSEDQIIWALKDVSFKVQRGEVVDIIGRNGAGKTTLLKILSRITEPTEGRARINSRVGSLGGLCWKGVQSCRKLN